MEEHLTNISITSRTANGSFSEEFLPLDPGPAHGIIANVAVAACSPRPVKGGS